MATVPDNDLGIVEWIIGGLSLLGLAISGVFHRRANQQDDRVSSIEAALRKEQKESAKELWEAHNDLRKDLTGTNQQILASMATKDDLRALESSIGRRIDDLRPRGGSD